MGTKETVKGLEEIKREIADCIKIAIAGIKLLDMLSDKIVRDQASMIIRNDLCRIKNRLSKLI